jgi:sulfatase modifying factor 1
LDELSDEMPLHRVKISRAFDLGKTEVTRAQFEKFLSLSGYIPESIRDKTGGYGYSVSHDRHRPEKADAFAGRDPAYSWKTPGFDQADHHPVVNVTWHDAMAMANWLTQKEGVTYRLPTEAEWEYACKAGTQTRYPHGNDPQSLTKWANLFDASATPHWQRWQDKALPGNDGYAFTSPVASFPPNAFGLHDMVGNAWEWVSDHYEESYYKTSPATDPLGPDARHLKVRRGGSWHTWPIYARCSYRNINAPDSRYTLLGMRLLREVAP